MSKQLTKSMTEKPKQDKKQVLPDINKYVEMMEKSLKMTQEEYIELRNKEHDETKMWYPYINQEEDIFTFIFGTYGIEIMSDLKSHTNVIKKHKDAYDNWMETFFNPSFNRTENSLKSGEQVSDEYIRKINESIQRDNSSSSELLEEMDRVTARMDKSKKNNKK